MPTNATHELPPMLKGTEQQQLAALRDYLVRLAQSLNVVDNATIITSSSNTKATKKLTDDLKQQATDLRSLIVKTADALNVQIETNTNSIDDINGTISTLGSTYVAQSAFGTYQQTMQTQIQNLSSGVNEIYQSIEQISTHDAAQDGLLSEYMTLINGQIRRGFIEDPDHPGQYLLGIAISQSLVFTSETRTDELDNVYYRIDSSLAQTFGLYTSTGWQFWVNGQKVGWFDSTSTSALHVASIITETNIRFGDDWIIDQNSNGIGLRYVGG